MTYLELCKCSFVKSIGGIFKLNQYDFYDAYKDISDGVKTLCCILVVYILNALYLAFFPITSIIVYNIHKKEIRDRKKQRENLIKRKFQV